VLSAQSPPCRGSSTLTFSI